MPDLSVVVPAFDEADRLGGSLERMLTYLRSGSESFEILVVDDGSRDGTAALAAGLDASEIRVLRHTVNRGKGAAVRTGMLASRGRRVLLSDADLSTPIEELERLEPHLSSAHVVLGSRAVPGARITRRQARYRELMGKAFNVVIRYVGGVRGFRDTQCGFKLFRGEAARDLFADVLLDGFAYDVEMVWLARRRGLRVVEVGVTWAHRDASRVHPVFDSLRMLRDVLRYRFLHRHRRSRR